MESRSVLRLLLLSPVQLSSMDTYFIYEAQFNPFFLAQLFFSILSQNYFRLSLAMDARAIFGFKERNGTLDSTELNVHVVRLRKQKSNN